MTDSSLPDLTICDREPITRLEHIQSFGFLLGLSNDWLIARASANLHQFLGVTAELAIGMRLNQLVVPSGMHEIRNHLSLLHAGRGTERVYGVTLLQGGPRFDIALHYSGDLLVVEGEPSSPDDGMDSAQLVRAMIGRLGGQANLGAFHNDAARQIRAVTGFDRVMIYRFDEQGAGEVIAEAARFGLESLLGLRYPASDIPQQARALYLANPFRVIADVSSLPVPLLPARSEGAQPIDLTFSVTRAVSPVHIEYLSNMGVGASLSISIIVDGRLWGLIACHHMEPRLPSFTLRSTAELFGQMYSMTLESWLRRESADDERRARALVDRMITSIAGDDRLLKNAEWLQLVMRDIVQCDGVAVVLQDGVFRSGLTPDEAALMQLSAWLSRSSASRVFHTDTLRDILPGLGDTGSDAAGLLALPISRKPRDYVLLFRREKLHEIRWGGDPNKAAIADASGMRLSPRKSFAVYTELVRGKARPFSERDRLMAEAVRAALIEVILRFAEISAEERQRATERQELLIAELNHRVRNILALIRGLISQTRSDGMDVSDYVGSLSGRVEALARAHDQVTRSNWGPGLLANLFEDEIAAYVPTKRERFVLEGPTLYLQPLAFSTLALVVHELVTNSSKYGALSAHGRVHVRLEHRPGDVLGIHWREQGGPPVQPPLKRGFGSVVIERTIPFDLQGDAVVRYNVAGLEADFFIPDRFVWRPPVSLDEESAVGTPPAVVDRTLASPRPLDGLSVLLLEDNMIVALEAEDLLRDLGAATIWSSPTIAGAARILQSERVDFAMLDINVGPETSLEFAGRLKQLAKPFIFASGYGEDVDLGGFHSAARTVKKPYIREDLAIAITQAMGRGDGAAA